MAERLRIAIPCAEGRLAMHFGHCREFALVDVEDGRVARVATAEPPAHAPGVLPAWLQEQGVNVVVAGGMGSRAQALFTQAGIRVVVGAPSLGPEEIARQYVDGTLAAGDNICDH